MITPDKNLESHGDTQEVRLKGVTLNARDGEYADALKFSNVQGVVVDGEFIFGGYEDCIDINRGCMDMAFRNLRLSSGGLYVATIKGGSSNILFENITVAAHGKETDFDIGNWSDQNGNLTHHIYFKNIKSEDGKPVRVRVLWGADVHVLDNSNVKITVVPKFFVWVWRLLRKHNIVK